MPNASAFIEGVHTFKGLKRVEVVVYRLYFKYTVETENCNSGSTSASIGNYSSISKNKKPLELLAKSFNAMSEDEQLAVLTQLFPRDFEVGGDDVIIGLESDADDDEDADDSKPFQAVVKKSTEYTYV
jgi:hypothetical protein